VRIIFSSPLPAVSNEHKGSRDWQRPRQKDTPPKSIATPIPAGPVLFNALQCFFRAGTLTEIVHPQQTLRHEKKSRPIRQGTGDYTKDI
jgi:hypothetical protein